jgi:glycosyltransferase involved in cell wall biosynthesis
VTRLVFVTQHVDPQHPVLAATVPKITALARRVDELVVLALGQQPAELPENVRVRTFGAGAKAARGARFAAALARELRPRPLAVVAHMCPIYAVLAAPLARPLGVPVLLWYTHWNASPTLRLATQLSTRLLSVDTRSYPLRSPKVRALGHGIDLSEFACRPQPDHDGLRLLALGRTSPSKGLPAVLAGVRLAREAGVAVELDVYGPSLTDEERAHRTELVRLGARVHDPVPRSEVPALLAEADALVNNMRAGAPDKVVYEACAACVPAFASNPVFDELLPAELRFERDRPETLAARLEAFARLERPAREALGRSLREAVAARHSVDHWADGVLAAIDG